MKDERWLNNGQDESDVKAVTEDGLLRLVNYCNEEVVMTRAEFDQIPWVIDLEAQVTRYRQLCKSLQETMAAERTGKDRLSLADRERIVALGNEVWLEARRAGAVHGIEEVAKMLRGKAGEAFANGLDDNARLLREVAKLVEVYWREAAAQDEKEDKEDAWAEIIQILGLEE